MIVARRFPQAEYHVRIVRGRQVMIPPRRRGLPFAHEDHRKVFRPDHEIIAPQVGDALPNLLIGIVVRASVYSVLLPVGRIMQARIAGMEKFVLHGQRHGHIRQQFAHQSDHLCPGMVFLKNEQVATLDKQPEQLRRRKTLRAPQITLATAQSMRYNNRASNRSPIQVSIVSGYSEVGIAPGLGAPWPYPGQSKAKRRKALQHGRYRVFLRLPKTAQNRL